MACRAQRWRANDGVPGKLRGSSSGRESLTKGTAQKGSAFARAALWISEGPRVLGYAKGKSFPGWGDLGTGLDAMRMDVDIMKGFAFVTP